MAKKMEQQVITQLENAEEHFEKASNELFRPEEDVVPYSVCENAYHSVASYLSSFLMKNGVDQPKVISIKDLLQKCRKLDKRFNDLHLAPLYHPTQGEDIWMNMDTARDYLLMAGKTRDLVNEIININTLHE